MMNFARVDMTVRFAGSSILDDCDITQYIADVFIELSAANTQSEKELWFITALKSAGPVFKSNKTSVSVAVPSAVVRQVVAEASASTAPLRDTPALVSISATSNSSLNATLFPLTPRPKSSQSIVISPSTSTFPTPSAEPFVFLYNGSASLDVTVFVDVLSMRLTTVSFKDFIESQNMVPILNERNVTQVEWTGWIAPPTQIDEIVSIKAPNPLEDGKTISPGEISTIVVLGSIAAGITGLVAIEVAMGSASLASTSLL